MILLNHTLMIKVLILTSLGLDQRSSSNRRSAAVSKEVGSKKSAKEKYVCVRHTCIYACMYTHTHTRARAHARTHTHTHIRARARAHTHTHTQCRVKESRKNVLSKVVRGVLPKNRQMRQQQAAAAKAAAAASSGKGGGWATGRPNDGFGKGGGSFALGNPGPVCFGRALGWGGSVVE